MKTYSSRGLQLSYREAGQGEPLLLLHGFPFSGRMWDPQLGLGGRCIIPDLSGFGSSEPTPEICRMSDLATDAAALLDHLEIERVVLGGLSMGGYAALAFAEMYPDRLSGLVLADTRAGADSPEARDKRLAAARDVMEKGSGILVEAIAPKMLGATTRSRRPDLVKQVGQWIAEAPPAGVAAAQRGMAERPDRSAVLPRIAVPTLVLVGEEDEVTPPDESRRMAEAIPGARLEVLRGAGHLSSLEAPEDFNRILVEFLLK
jgi:3-oxoadipate enol-lactonase